MAKSFLPHDIQNKGDGSNKKVNRFTVLILILYQSGHEIHFFLAASCWFLNILKWQPISKHQSLRVNYGDTTRDHQQYLYVLHRQVKNFQSEFNFDLQHVHVCIFEIKDGIQLKIFLMTYEEIYSAHHHCHRSMFMAWYTLNSNIHKVFKEGVTMKLRF